MKKHLYLFLFMFLFISPAYAEESAIEAKVIAMFNGEEFTALANDGKLMPVKLYGIYCPAFKQPFAQQAAQTTADAVLGKQVEITVIGTDASGNMLSVVKYGSGRVLQETLLSYGMAWVYNPECTIGACYRWVASQGNAKARRSGLWSDSNPIPPWEWRRQQGR